MEKRGEIVITTGTQKTSQIENHPVHKIRRTKSQKIADAMTSFTGSWGFIVAFALFLIIWIGINILAVFQKWDPYPFVFLNLVLGILTSIEAPVILMSQNREAQLDRLRAEYDYNVNKLAEQEIRDLKEEVKDIKKLLEKR
jgi:uncharacterized membrane protein